MPSGQDLQFVAIVPIAIEKALGTPILAYLSQRTV